jgi:hypothetical protein
MVWVLSISIAMRRLGVLMTFTPDDAVGQARVAALLQGLQQAGWEIGRNLGIDIRWSDYLGRTYRPRQRRPRVGQAVVWRRSSFASFDIGLGSGR